MQKTKCIHCGDAKEVKGWKFYGLGGQVFPICRVCYEKLLEVMKESKKAKKRQLPEFDELQDHSLPES